MDKICHDCKKEIEVEGEEIKNGVLLQYEENGEKIGVFKCSECYSKNPSLTNFRKCEVYSRIVGYLRPVQQWNEGKKAEYEARKEFKISEL
ncbi:MAG: anaerobic ribonucleoside-triphosphate reductase [Candidatus Paceibacterota bacterium]|jgi:ribonucleoside-triphosphate reductase